MTSTLLQQAVAVPLVEQLRSVPAGAVLRMDTPNALGCMDTSSIPVGRLCHEAAAALQQQEEPVAKKAIDAAKAFGKNVAAQAEKPFVWLPETYLTVGSGPDGWRFVFMHTDAIPPVNSIPLYRHAASPSLQQQEEPREVKLWCVNVWGPDDLYAMSSKAAALERANSMNIEFGSIPRHEHDPILLAVVIEWPHTPESHAEDLSRYAASPSPQDFTIPMMEDVHGLVCGGDGVQASASALPAKVDVSEAMARYLRRCRSGGLTKKESDLIGGAVEDAQRLGYFDAPSAGMGGTPK